MNKIEKDINVTKYDIPVRIHYVQGTNAIPLIFHVKDYDIPSGSTARVYVKRPDGTAEYDNAVLNGNTVTVAVKKTMFSVVGDSRLQIRIAKGEDVMVSFEILVDVRKNHADGGVKSENATDIFDETLKDLDEAAKEAGIKAGEAAESAKVAKASETNAASFAAAAANSATSVAGSAATATTKADEAAASARAAKISETNAAGSATNAQLSAETAKVSETNAAKSEESAENHALTSKSYAVGTGNVVRPSDSTDNSRAYAELAQRLVEGGQKLLDQAQKIVSAATAGSLIPAGTIAFDELPEEPKVGYMYNISDDFTTDARFAEGPGVFYRAGANVYWSKDGQWDVMVGVQVTGVKGEAESEYRFGNVNITRADIGLEKVPNVATNEQVVTFTQASTRENITSGNKMSVLMGKIMKVFADLKAVAFSGKYSDLSGTPSIGNGTVTIKQNGTSKGSFTMNQSGNTEIALTDSDTKYTLPLASSSARGGVKTGYSANGKNYPVQLSNEQMYVNVPWTDTNTTYSAATASAAGLMSAADKKKLDGVASSANAYSLPLASSSARGGVKTGYSANGKNYPVQLSNEQMYVNVPWTDTNTTYGNMKGATASAAGAAGLTPAPAAGAANRYLRSDGTWQVPPDTNTVYTHPTTAGNKHIPAGGAAGQFLKWSAAGTAAWASLVNNLLATVAGNPLDATQGKILDDKITALNGKLATTKATLWTNATIIRKGDMRIIILDVANIASKATLPSGDRPSSNISTAILINGGAAAVTVKTSGVLDFSNASGYVNSGNAMGQIVYMV